MISYLYNKLRNDNACKMTIYCYINGIIEFEYLFKYVCITLIELVSI